MLKVDISRIRIASSSGERMLYSRDQSDIPRFLKDALFESLPEAVVQAESSEAVLEVLKFASSSGMPVVTRGSGSSPFGGSVPVVGGLVLDVSRLDRVLSIDGQHRTATVEAGVRWADLDNELGKQGLALMTSPSSKFSTVGGWISTGGIGVNSFSVGHLSRIVLSLELATPSGELVTLTQADEHFPLVFGSEGQLGVVTKATIQVKEKPKLSKPHLLIFKDRGSAVAFAGSAAETKPVHIVYESALRVEYTNRMLDKRRIASGDAVIVYIEDERSERAFGRLVKDKGITEEPEYLARYVWNERFFPMKIRKFGPGMLGMEVIAPVQSLESMMSSISELSSGMGIEPMFEVHLLPDDEALMLCFYMTDQGNKFLYTLDAVKSMLLTRKAVDLGARPYSVGIWNHPFSDVHERDRRKDQRKLKASYDPRGIMNAGKYFRLSGRLGPIVGLVMHPRLVTPLLKTVLELSRASLPAINMMTRFFRERSRADGGPTRFRITDECAMCGACVSVCPAYMIVKDERVTARGKMLTAKALASGASLTKEHAHRTSLCMRCKACEQVCQSKLELIPFYEELERQLEQHFDRDQDEIERFIKFAEASPEYDELIARGLVIGAPKNSRGGGPDAL